MKKSLLTATIAIFVSIFMFNSAQSQSYNLNNRSSLGYEWGNVFNTPGATRDKSGPIEIFNADVGFDANSIIGCNGIDLKSAFKGILKNLSAGDIGKQIGEYFKTGMANYLLTQVYSSPAIAAIFDSLEAFGNARVSMMQQKCMSGPQLKEAGAEAWAARNAQNECVVDEKKKGNSGAECFAGASDKILSGISKQLSLPEMNGSFYELLGGEKELGDLTKFLPDFKFCAGGQRCNYDKPTKTKPEITQGEQFQIAKGGSQAYTETFLAAGGEVLSKYGKAETYRRAADWLALTAQNDYVPQELIIAEMEERSFENPFISNIQLKSVGLAADHFESINPDWGSADEIMIASAISALDDEFLEFINCQDPVFGKATVEFFTGAFPGFKPTNIYSVNLGQYSGLNFGVGAGTSYSQAIANNSDSDLNSTLSAVRLMGIAISCVYNHNISMNPVDYIRLSEAGKSRANAILEAMADQIAFLSVEVVLRFTKHKLLDLYAKGVFSTDADSDDPVLDEYGDIAKDANGDLVQQTVPMPPHILKAVEMVAETIENRIATLKAVKSAQRDFSKMMADFHKWKDSK